MTEMQTDAADAAYPTPSTIVRAAPSGVWGWRLRLGKSLIDVVAVAISLAAPGASKSPAGPVSGLSVHRTTSGQGPPTMGAPQIHHRPNIHVGRLRVCAVWSLVWLTPGLGVAEPVIVGMAICCGLWRRCWW